MRKLLKRLEQRIAQRRDKRGSADLVVTLLTIPIAVFLILALIDVSIYMGTRQSITAETRDATRLAALWGGVSGAERLNTQGKSIETILSNKIAPDGKCAYSGCTKAPTVICTVNGQEGVQATSAGQIVRCSVTYYYRTVTPGANLLGFEGITGSSFTTTSQAITETGYRK